MIFKKITPLQLILIGYLSVIVIGAIVLKTPMVIAQGAPLGWVDAIFTATSAVCVTGLIVVDTITKFNVWGQLAIIILVQIGGLGYMTFASLFILLMKKNFTLKSRMAIQEGSSFGDLNDIRGELVKIFKLVFGIEVAAAIILIIFFHGKLSLFDTVFQTISAFCNAGFYTIDFMLWKDSWLFNLVIMSLIVMGGIGYFVINDLITNYKSLSLHSKIVLISTAILLISATAIFYLIEDVSFLQAMFTSVTARTAGFSIVDLNSFHPGSVFLLIILMFIGASPGGTGGGIKTATIAVLMIAGVSFLKGHKKPVAFKRSISPAAFRKAFIIFFSALFFIVGFTLLINSLEPTIALQQISFEVVSALGTVGLSLGATTQISWISKLLVVILMLIGRIGVFLISAMLISSKEEAVNFPEERVLL
jgi:trk system potassium uptake protein TrkH